MHLCMCRVEYCTWAGMIVTQYGRFPGSHAANGVLYNGAQGGSPPRQSAALGSAAAVLWHWRHLLRARRLQAWCGPEAGPPDSAACLQQSIVVTTPALPIRCLSLLAACVAAVSNVR